MDPVSSLRNLVAAIDKTARTSSLWEVKELPTSSKGEYKLTCMVLVSALWQDFGTFRDEIVIGEKTVWNCASKLSTELNKQYSVSFDPRGTKVTITKIGNFAVYLDIYLTINKPEEIYHVMEMAIPKFMQKLDFQHKDNILG